MNIKSITTSVLLATTAALTGFVAPEAQAGYFPGANAMTRSEANHWCKYFRSGSHVEPEYYYNQPTGYWDCRTFTGGTAGRVRMK